MNKASIAKLTCFCADHGMKLLWPSLCPYQYLLVKMEVVHLCVFSGLHFIHYMYLNLYINSHYGIHMPLPKNFQYLPFSQPDINYLITSQPLLQSKCYYIIGSFSVYDKFGIFWSELFIVYVKE